MISGVESLGIHSLHSGPINCTSLTNDHFFLLHPPPPPLSLPTSSSSHLLSNLRFFPSSSYSSSTASQEADCKSSLHPPVQPVPLILTIYQKRYLRQHARKPTHLLVGIFDLALNSEGRSRNHAHSSPSGASSRHGGGRKIASIHPRSPFHTIQMGSVRRGLLGREIGAPVRDLGPRVPSQSLGAAFHPSSRRRDGIRASAICKSTP